jgi:hypothetical protein
MIKQLTYEELKKRKFKEPKWMGDEDNGKKEKR